MQTVDESTMDDVITTVDFATLFSQEELKAKRAEEKDRRKKNRILSVENSHFLIYLIRLYSAHTQDALKVPYTGKSSFGTSCNSLEYWVFTNSDTNSFQKWKSSYFLFEK